MDYHLQNLPHPTDMHNKAIYTQKRKTAQQQHSLFAGLGKKRPKDHEMEQVVLGALMLENDAIEAVIDIISGNTFDKSGHAKIFQAIVGLHHKSEPIDMMTVTNALRASGELEFVGGAYAVAELTQRVNSAANIVYHSRILAQYAIKRGLIDLGSQMVNAAYDDTMDVFELLDTTEQNLFEISEQNIKKEYQKFSHVLFDTFEEMEAQKDREEGFVGVPSGFSALDALTKGWQNSDLVIIAARPGMGKTSFVLSAMRNAAVQFEKGVAIFSLEMSAQQLAKRVLACESGISAERMKDAKQLTPQEWDRLLQAATQLEKAPMYVDDTPSLSILELRAKCRRLKAKNDIGLIIIDYLQLMSGGEKDFNREQEISKISRSLKQLAKELDVPVLALSQLSRAVETRGSDKRPKLSDLRESGSIEQDADMVIFLYRPEYYGITEMEDGTTTRDLAEVIIAKHRNGSLDNVKLKFTKALTKFSDWKEDPFIQNAGFDQDGNDIFEGQPTAFQPLKITSKPLPKQDINGEISPN